jgi:enoyl-CoA hydratase/3-hydroxyacyl-CoA dehydrogenase
MNVDISNIKIISVIGAGTMGREITEVALMSGIFEKVILHDISNEALSNAVDFIERGIKKIESKGKLAEGFTTESVMKNLIIETDLIKAIEDSDFIVEAIPEVMKLKQDLFEKLGKFSPKHSILATNTSTMSITDIASTSGRDGKVVGMHFFTPIPVLRLIEIIKGEKTSMETLDIAVAVGEKLPALKGKRILPVIQKERPGFIVNRLLITNSLYINWLLDEAVEKGIPFEQIDADLDLFGDLGPLARADYLGLDIMFDVLNYFAEKLSPDFKPRKTLKKFVDEGNLGRKTGKGLFVWKKGVPILDKSKKAGMFDLDLYMAIQLNEGCRLLEEGVVSGYKEIDDTWMAGMDMPGPFGPGKRNYKKWSKMLEEFSKKSGLDYVKPCELMKSGGFLKMRK